MHFLFRTDIQIFVCTTEATVHPAAELEDAESESWTGAGRQPFLLLYKIGLSYMVNERTY